MSISQEKQNNLQQWLTSINCFQSFTQNDILNGMLIYKILLNVSPQSSNSTKQITNSMTTLSRATNWNILTEELKKLMINLSQQQKSKIIGGNQEIVIEIVSKLKQFHLRKQKTSQVDLTQIDPKKDVKDTKSLLQMLLILMMKNFHLSAKEAVALLSNQSKYLAHILTKGLKGQFKGIENFLFEMNKNLEKIIQYCRQNQQNVVFFLRSIKPALISKSETVSSVCLQFFNRYLQCYSLNQRLTIFGTHLQSTYLLTTKRHPVLQAEVILYIFEDIFKEKKSKQSIKGDEIMKISKQEKIKLRQQLIKEVFDSLSNQRQKFGMILSVIKVFREENKLKQIIQVQFFSKLIQKSIERIKEKENTQICIDIALSLCQYAPQLFSPQQDYQSQEKYNLNPREVSLNLLESLKSCTSQSQLIPFSLQLFSLLQYFGQNKHFIAPNLYKLILQKFSEIEDTKSDLYQLYLLNFMEIIKQFPSIPWNPILQNILARKKSNQISEDNQVREFQLDFFLFLLNQQNIDIKNSLVIFDYVSKLFIETYHLAGYLIQIMIKVIDLFQRTQPIVQQLTLKLIKVCLAIHHANTKKFSHKRKSLTGNTKTTDEEALMKIKNNSIQFFVFKTAQLQIDQINHKIQPLVAFNYLQMKDKQEYVKGFKKILEVIGEFSQIIERYQNQIKKAEQQAKQLQRLQKISKEKEKERERQRMSQSKIITKAHSRSRYEQDYDSAKKLDTNYDETIGHKGQSFSMHVRPFNGSYLGITPSAQKGIQKFQKVYLNKIQKQDFQKIRKQQEQQKFEMMKKIYRKKMVSQYGIDIKGETDQIQYLFQFDSLQDNDQRNFTKVPFYTNETQEDRDMLACQKLLKTYQKPLKVIYSMYSGQKKGQLPQNFDEIAEKNTVIGSSSLFKLLKDFGFQDYVSLRQVQQLCQKVNNVLNPSTTDYQILDFQGFIEFFKQLSFLMFTRPPKDLRGQPLAMMLEETFSNLKLFAGENKVNEQIFEEPNSIFFNETEAVAQLNKKLMKNPDYILPEGYKKIVDKRINFEYGIFLQALSVNYKVVFEVLDQLLFEALGVHVMQPFTREEKITRARPALFVAERLKIDSMPAKHIPVSLKKEIMRIPIKSRTQAKQCAIVIDDIITAIQLGHDQIGQRHMNKVQAERKKQMDQQIRRIQQQKRRRQNRNRQAKSAIEQYKQKRDQRQKQKSMKKQQQQRKIKQQKQRKQKQAEELKKKIDQYNKKKKQQQEQKLKNKKQFQEKQKRQREKFKQLNQETRRKIQEEKRKKQEQENIKKAQKQAEEKRIKELEKKKLMESQIIKKKMVQEFKLRKSQVRDLGSPLNKSINNQTNKFSSQINRSINKELKNLQSYGGDSNNESRIHQ